MMKDKLIPKRRFKEFENHEAWKQCKLGDNAIIKGRLGWKSLKKDEYTKKGPCMIAGKHINNGIIDWMKVDHIPKWRYEESPEIMLEKGDVIFSKDGTLGNPAVIENLQCLATINSTMMLVRTDDTIDPKFFYQVLKSNQFKRLIYLKVSGSSIPHLFQADMKEFEFWAPHIEEQQKIGTFFNRLDNLITLYQRKLKKLKELKLAYLSELFPKEGEKYPIRRFAGFTDPWEQCKVSLIAERFDNLRIPVTASNRIPGNTPYYGANGILDYVDGFTHDGEYVLIAEDGANDLNDYPVHYVNGKIWVNNHAHVIKAKEDIADNKFLKYAFKILDVEPYLVGGSRAKLNADIMMGLIIYTPKLDEQIKLGKFFSSLDNLITLNQRKLDKLENIKKAYLHEMFV